MISSLKPQLTSRVRRIPVRPITVTTPTRGEPRPGSEIAVESLVYACSEYQTFRSGQPNEEDRETTSLRFTLYPVKDSQVFMSASSLTKPPSSYPSTLFSSIVLSSTSSSASAILCFDRLEDLPC